MHRHLIVSHRSWVIDKPSFHSLALNYHFLAVIMILIYLVVCLTKSVLSCFSTNDVITEIADFLCNTNSSLPIEFKNLGSFNSDYWKCQPGKIQIWDWADGDADGRLSRHISFNPILRSARWIKAKTLVLW